MYFSLQAAVLTGDTKSQTELETLFSLLDQATRRQGRVLARDITRTFNVIERSRHCPASQTLLLIKCCGDVLVDVDRTKRNLLVEKCFSLLESIPGTRLDISHYNALLKVKKLFFFRFF